MFQKIKDPYRLYAIYVSFYLLGKGIMVGMNAALGGFDNLVPTGLGIFLPVMGAAGSTGDRMNVDQVRSTRGLQMWRMSLNFAAIVLLIELIYFGSLILLDSVPAELRHGFETESAAFNTSVIVVGCMALVYCNWLALSTARGRLFRKLNQEQE